MHILILVDCYLPVFKSGPKQIHDLSVEFLRHGHEVTVVTATNGISRDMEMSVESGVRVVRVKSPQIKGASHLRRGLNEARISALVWRIAGGFLSKHPADLIVFYSPTIFWGALVRRLKAMWHCQSYLILRDIFPEWAVNAGVLRRGLIYRYFRRKEAEQYGIADVIGVQSCGDLDYFRLNFGGKNFELEVLLNWTPLKEPNLPKTEFRLRLGLVNRVVFFYGGNLGIAQDIDNILKLAANLAGDSRIFFLVVGEGSEARRLEATIARRRLPNIRRLPPVEQREFISMVSEFDVGLISLDRRLKNHNIPGKLMSYFYSAIPVLASINAGSDLFALIEENQAGLCLVNGEDEKLRAAALQLANDSDLRRRMGRNGRWLLEEKFSVEAAAQQILKHLPQSTVPPEPRVLLPGARVPVSS
jgi:glycosyltransferase involved in cell wall biosynthesis